MTDPSGPRARLTALAARGRHVAVDTVWASVTNGFRLGSSLLLFWWFADRVGLTEYGLYAGTQGVAVVVNLLFVAWIPMLHMQRTLRDGEDPDAVFASSWTAGLAGGALGLAVSAALHAVILPQVPLSEFMALIAAEMVISIGVENAAAAAQVRRGFVRACQVRWIGIAAKPITVALVWQSADSLADYARILIVVASVISLGVLAGTMIVARIPLRFGTVRMAHLREGVPYLGSAAILAFQDDGDKTVMVRTGHRIDAGPYAAMYRIMQILMFPIDAVVSATHPRVIVPAGPNPRQTIRRAVRYTVPATCYGLVAGVGLALLAGPIARFVGEEVDSATDMLRLLAPLLALRAASGIAANSLIAFGRNRTRLLLTIGAAAFNFALYVALIPPWSWKGAIAATAATDLVYAVAVWVTLLRVGRTSSDLVTPSAPVPTGA